MRHSFIIEDRNQLSLVQSSPSQQHSQTDILWCRCGWFRGCIREVSSIPAGLPRCSPAEPSSTFLLALCAPLPRLLPPSPPPIPRSIWPQPPRPTGPPIECARPSSIISRKMATPSVCPVKLCSAPTLTRPSPLVASRPSLGSDPAVHKCWYEPVQVHLPGHRRSAVRLCQFEARRQLAEGTRHFRIDGVG